MPKSWPCSKPWDMGKPIGDSLGIDIPGAAQALSWSGEAIDKDLR
jgi:hypothetical protein